MSNGKGLTEDQASASVRITKRITDELITEINAMGLSDEDAFAMTMGIATSVLAINAAAYGAPPEAVGARVVESMREAERIFEIASIFGATKRDK